MIVPYASVLLLSVLLFLMGAACAISRRNLLMILIGVEVMLNAAGIAFVGASLKWRLLDGQAFVVFILAVAASEVAVGLSLVVHSYRRTRSLGADDYNRLVND